MSEDYATNAIGSDQVDELVDMFYFDSTAAEEYMINSEQDDLAFYALYDDDDFLHYQAGLTPIAGISQLQNAEVQAGSAADRTEDPAIERKDVNQRTHATSENSSERTTKDSSPRKTNDA